MKIEHNIQVIDEERCSPKCPHLSPDWVCGFCGLYKILNAKKPWLKREFLKEEVDSDGRTASIYGHMLRLNECKILYPGTLMPLVTASLENNGELQTQKKT